MERREREKTVCLILLQELVIQKNAVCEHFKTLAGSTEKNPKLKVSSSYLCGSEARPETNSILCWPAEARLSSKTLHMEDNSVNSRWPERSSYRYPSIETLQTCLSVCLPSVSTHNSLKVIFPCINQVK